ANGVLGDGPVVVAVVGLAGAGVDDPAAGAGDPRHGVADHAEDVALALVDVHGDALVGEAEVVLGAAVVQLADRGDVVALRREPVAPAGDAAVVGGTVVPVADVVDVAAGREAGPGWDADGAVGVGVGEADATGGQRVEVRRLDDRMAVAAEHPTVVLVGHHVDEVHRLHARRLPMVLTDSS